MGGQARIHLAVWLVLVVLLAMTVAASFAPLGPLSPVASLGIALVKSALIFWFYMHLGREGALVRLVGFGAAAWLLVLLGLTVGEVVSRAWW